MFSKTSSQLLCSLVWCWGSSEAGHLLGSTSQSSVEAQIRRRTCPAVQQSQTEARAIITRTHQTNLQLFSIYSRGTKPLGESPLPSRISAPPRHHPLPEPRLFRDSYIFSGVS